MISIVYLSRAKRKKLLISIRFFKPTASHNLTGEGCVSEPN